MVKLNKDSKHLLDLNLKILDYGLELASQKEDMEAIMAISDRMLAIFQYVSEADSHKPKMGFHIAHRDTEDEGHDSDE